MEVFGVLEGVMTYLEILTGWTGCAGGWLVVVVGSVERRRSLMLILSIN